MAFGCVCVCMRIVLPTDCEWEAFCVCTCRCCQLRRPIRIDAWISIDDRTGQRRTKLSPLVCVFVCLKFIYNNTKWCKIVRTEVRMCDWLGGGRGARVVWISIEWIRFDCILLTICRTLSILLISLAISCVTSEVFSSHRFTILVASVRFVWTDKWSKHSPGSSPMSQSFHSEYIFFFCTKCVDWFGSLLMRRVSFRCGAHTRFEHL